MYTLEGVNLVPPNTVNVKNRGSNTVDVKNRGSNTI